MNTLEALKKYTRIVADTGNFEEIATLKPEEATTNPTLILKAFENEDGANIINEAKTLLPQPYSVQTLLPACSVVIAKKILQYIPGRVSIEVDARLSFETEATVATALHLIELARKAGIDARRILIKIASTWEGIQAAKILEEEGVACNCTLIFHKIQALACAQANVTLISPFVGRIYDWYKAHGLYNEQDEDPGVKSVKEIFYLLKSQGYKTEIMGASFRNLKEILALTGCDRLTIAPKFLKELSEQTESLTPQLVQPSFIEKMPPITEKEFRWQLNQDAMATEKLAEGIRLFAQDCETLLQKIGNYSD